MAASIRLRTDYNANDPRQLSRQSSDSKQTRQLLALALIYDGSPRYEAARHANVDVQSIRDWVLRFNAEGPGGFRPPGREPQATATPQLGRPHLPRLIT